MMLGRIITFLEKDYFILQTKPESRDPSCQPESIAQVFISTNIN